MDIYTILCLEGVAIILLLLYRNMNTIGYSFSCTNCCKRVNQKHKPKQIKKWETKRQFIPDSTMAFETNFICEECIKEFH